MSKSIRNKFYIGETVEFTTAISKENLKGEIRTVHTDFRAPGILEYVIRGEDKSIYYVPEANISRIIPKFKPGDRVIVRGFEYLGTRAIDSVYSSAPNKYWVKYFAAPIHASKMTLAPDIIEFGECG